MSERLRVKWDVICTGILVIRKGYTSKFWQHLPFFLETDIS